MTGQGRRPGEQPGESPVNPSDERTVEHPVQPGEARSCEDDATADLLRGVLRRQAEAVHPSPDGLAKILAAARGSDTSARGTFAGDPRTAKPPSGGVPPGDRTVPVPIRGENGRPVPRAQRNGTWFGRPHPLTLGIPSPSRSPRVPGWLPMLAAAAAVVLMVGGLGMSHLGVLGAPSLANVVGDPAASAPAPHPPTVDPLPVYFVQRQNDRWALVREFAPTTLTDPADRLTAALRLAVSGKGTDPDHTSAWNAAGVRVQAEGLEADDAEGTVVIRLPGRLLGNATPSGDDGKPPLGDLAVAQLVWTATATVHDDAPVRIEGPSATALLFGEVRLGHAFERDTSASGDPRAPVWVSSLVDGQRLSPGKAVIQGDAVTTERGTVAWRLVPEGSAREVAQGLTPLHREDGSTPASGERGVWQVTLQLPTEGRYVLQVSQPWPQTRAGLPQPDTDWLDTKTLVVG